MNAGGATSEVLLQRPWLPVNISSCQLLAKSWFGDASYHILLTDIHCVWEERMDSAAIQKRAQELNRRLRAPVKSFFSHLCKVVQPSLTEMNQQPDDKAQISLTQQEGNISMKLKSELAGLPFYWEFHCTPAPISVVCVQLVRPLLTMSQLLQRQVEHLSGLLVRKDAEIQDYRENGATLSRERLQTEAFDEQTHRGDFIAKTVPLLFSEQHDVLSFDGDLQNLYTTITAHKNTRKRKLSEEHCVEDNQLPAKEPEPPSGESVRSEQAEADEQKQNGQMDSAGANMAKRPTVQQSLPVNSNPSERPSSKPKKKKVGLFR